MMKKLYQLVFGRDFELRESLFRASNLAGCVIVVTGILESIVIKSRLIAFLPLLIFLAVLIIGLFATFKYRKMEFSATVIGLVMILFVFPSMFFFSGGIEGGASIWFVFALFYIFMMFSGKKLVLFFLLTFFVEITVYRVAYLHPELVDSLNTQKNIFLDSFFGVSVVGCIGGVFLKFQMKLFEKERAVTEAQKKELENMGSAKNKFFASMSHEIRTPINTIIGLNQMILRENQDELTRQYAEYIQSASKMLLSLVNDILDLSQLEMKKMEIVPEEYHTIELVEELVNMIQVRMKEKNLEFIVDVDEKIPSVLFGDKKRIQQVLLNILANAVKYTNSGSVTFTLGAENISQNEISLKFSVTDTGIGIRKEDLEYIYDSFRRVDQQMNSNVEGSGLGLSISKYLIDLMGGELTVDSIYTKGSVFTVILNQRIVDSEPIGAAEFFKQGSEIGYVPYQQSFEAPEARILVVDDNDMNRYVIGQLLGATKVIVEQAASGAECLEKTKQRFYHVILMDYRMPEMDGAETLQKLRRQENGLCRESAVLLLSADSLNETRRVCVENRFDGYVEKPIQGASLEAEILDVLPEEIVEYREKKVTSGKRKNYFRQISGRKRKSIYISSDCVCDLPVQLLEKYDIKLLYFYIKTERGRFADTKEINSDSLTQYLSQEGGLACADSVSVEECEEFFAEMLTQADHVIHIAMAEYAGKGYETAKTAAKGFDHVHVIDSGLISGGEGLVVLYAAKLAKEGYHTSEICKMVEKMKQQVEARYFLSNVHVFYQTGHIGKFMAKICNAFQLHPALTLKQSRLVVVGLKAGRMEGVWKRYICEMLRKKKKISTDVVIITHVGCSVHQLELVQKEILKQIPFQRVIVQKASVSVGCNSGPETVGIAYYLR